MGTVILSGCIVKSGHFCFCQMLFLLCIICPVIVPGRRACCDRSCRVDLFDPSGQHIQCVFTMFVTCIVNFVTGTPCKNTRCVLVTLYHRFDITFCIGLQIITFYFYIRSVIVGIVISGFIKNDRLSICCFIKVVMIIITIF